MDGDGWQVPRCRHGRIIYACPDGACPEQNAAIRERDAAVKAYYDAQAATARRLVREALGIPAT